jgi:hypothetical protein
MLLGLARAIRLLHLIEKAAKLASREIPSSGKKGGSPRVEAPGRNQCWCIPLKENGSGPGG